MKKNPHFLNVLFSFYNFFLHDDGALLIFYLDYLNVLKDILGYLSSNNFKIHKKWFVVNIGFKLPNLEDPFKIISWLPHLVFCFLAWSSLCMLSLMCTCYLALWTSMYGWISFGSLNHFNASNVILILFSSCFQIMLNGTILLVWSFSSDNIDQDKPRTSSWRKMKSYPSMG